MNKQNKLSENGLFTVSLFHLYSYLWLVTMFYSCQRRNGDN